MDTPRCTRIRRRFGPKAHSLMARPLPQERYQPCDAVGAGRRGPLTARYVLFFYSGLRIWLTEGTEATVQHGETGKRRPHGEDKCLLFRFSFSRFCSPLLGFSVLFPFLRPLRRVLPQSNSRRGAVCCGPTRPATMSALA